MAQPTERESSPTLRASRAQDTRDALTELGRQQASKRRMPKLLRSLFSNKLATMSVFILLVMIFVAIFAPVLTNDDPRIGQIIESKRPPMWAEGGSSDFPLGTDPLGRDVLTRILYGARISLIVGFASVFIAGVIAAGNNANEIFIENGRFHGQQIAAAIAKKQALKNSTD